MILYGEDLSSLNLYSSASKITVLVRLTTSLSICASERLTTKTPFLLTDDVPITAISNSY